MSKSAQTQLNKTKDIRQPSRRVLSLYGDFRDCFFDEAEAPKNKDRWRKDVFQTGSETPLHLEIGPGAGRHFAKLCLAHPKDCFLAIELKYKPLAQTLGRLKSHSAFNGKGIRHNAALLDQLFGERELNDTYIHFPDPWPKKRHKKHRLISPRFAKILWTAQKPKARLEFKTDALAYFRDSVEILQKAGYTAAKYTEDLHQGKNPKGAKKDFLDQLSQFEAIFFRQNLPIGYALLEKS